MTIEPSNAEEAYIRTYVGPAGESRRAERLAMEALRKILDNYSEPGPVTIRLAVLTDLEERGFVEIMSYVRGRLTPNGLLYLAALEAKYRDA